MTVFRPRLTPREKTMRKVLASFRNSGQFRGTFRPSNSPNTMIDPSKTSRLKAFSRRFTTAILPAVAVGALFASAQSAHALTAWQRAFQAQVQAADIEDIAEAAVAGVNTLKPNNKPYPVSRARIYARLAGLAIAGKTGTGPQFSIANKQDETAETVAAVIGAIATDARLLKVKKTPSLAVQVRNIIRDAIKNAGIAVTADYVRDIVGSAALTVHNTAAQDANELAIRSYLVRFANKTSLLGTRANSKNQTLVDAVIAGVTQGFDGNNTNYEDGSPTGINLINTADPETDFRPA